MTLDEIKAIVLFMKEQGATKFTVKDVSVEFSPFEQPVRSVQSSLLDDRQVKIQEVRDLVKFANNEEEADLMWSAK